MHEPAERIPNGILPHDWSHRGPHITSTELSCQKSQIPYLQMRFTANDGVLDMAAVFYDHIIHHNGANNLHTVA